MLDTAATANPPPYSKVCDTSRPRVGQCATTRTDLGRIRFVDFLKPSSVRNRLVVEHVAKGRPACIKYRLSHAGLGESGSVHITHCDVVELQHDASRELVLKIPAGICWSTTPRKLLCRPWSTRSKVCPHAGCVKSGQTWQRDIGRVDSGRQAILSHRWVAHLLRCFVRYIESQRALLEAGASSLA